MSRVYSAVLTGDQLEWNGKGPRFQQPVEVTVTVPDEADLLPPEERRRRIAEALEALAASGGIDYEAWLASRTVLTSAICDFTLLTTEERLKLAERLLESVGPEERAGTPEEGESWESVRDEIAAQLASRRASAT